MPLIPCRCRTRRLAVITLAALVCGACSGARAPVAPETSTPAGADAVIPSPAPHLKPAAGPAFYPLEVGNSWEYDGTIVDDLHFDDGRSFHEERDYVQTNVLFCEEVLDGTRYVVELQTVDFGSVGLAQWLWYRQSGAGLFQLDLPTITVPRCAIELGPSAKTEPAPEPELPEAGASRAACLRARATLMERLEWARRAAGGDAPSGTELTRLAYPLYVGAQWRIRSEPLLRARVMAFERVHLPAGDMAGFKVQIISELFGPRDRVYFWVSRNGFLAFSADMVAPIIEIGDTPIGEATLHEERVLTDYRIARTLPWLTSGATPSASEIGP